VDPELQKIALKGYPKGEEPISTRPADVLEPELSKAKAEIGDLAKNRKDLLLYTIFPTTGKRFLEVKYGKAAPPPEWAPRTLEQAKAEEELIKKALKGETMDKPKKEAPPKGQGIRAYRVYVDGEYFEVEVEGVGGAPVITSVAPAVPAAPAAPAVAPVATPAPAVAPAAAPAKPAAGAKSNLLAPMPGMVVDYVVKPGDAVRAGDVVVILEAMKMENGLEAPVDGVVAEVFFAKGDSVPKDAVLLTIN
jgi:biotin carboxyl carrier protein